MPLGRGSLWALCPSPAVWGWEWRGDPPPAPQTPALLLPQLSYNMVSACNRLCRMRLLCSPRTEGEELVRCWGCIPDTGGLCHEVPLPGGGGHGLVPTLQPLCAPLCPQRCCESDQEEESSRPVTLLRRRRSSCS